VWDPRDVSLREITTDFDDLDEEFTIDAEQIAAVNPPRASNGRSDWIP
jgi:hypothetical protein